MSQHTLNVSWALGDRDFTYQAYSRDHEWRFDSGTVVPASASPDYRGGEDCVDPEEALIASLSSCHMLTFLALCTKEKLVVRSYEDNPVGYLEPTGDGNMWMARVVLHPKITYDGEAPNSEVLDRLHHQAHEMCFMANSVKTEITVESP